MNAPLYGNGKFCGALDSIEHQMHCMRTAYLQSDEAEERAAIEEDFAELQVSAEGAAAVQRMIEAWGGTIPAPGDAGAVMTGAGTQRKPREFLSTQDFTAPGRIPSGYVVKGILGRGSYAELFGAPGEGKTFAALSIAYAVAQGREWMGHKVNGGLVLYIPYEGGGGLVKRVQALVQRYGDAPRFRVVVNPDYNLRELSGRRALAEDMAAALGDEKPVLIIFDTFARAMANGDENAAVDVSAFNAAVAALIEKTGTTVLLIHHSGKDRSKGARGSSALLGALDTELEATGGAIHSRKQRDWELAPPIGFNLVPVVVGEDEDHEPIVSCVIEPAVCIHKEQPLSAQARDALKALCDLAPNNEPVGARAWQAAFERIAWPVDPPEAKSRRIAFRRAVKTLGDRVTSPEVGQWQRAMSGDEE